MRYTILLLLFFAGIAIPAGLFVYHFHAVALEDGLMQLLIAGLMITPIVVAFIGGVALFFQAETYHYVPLPGVHDDSDTHRLEDSSSVDTITKQSVDQISSLESFIRARVLAICTDIETAHIHQSEIYHAAVHAQLSAYIQQQKEFIHSGWAIQFGLRVAEPHRLNLVYEFSDDEFLVECEGIFDCIASYGAIQHSVPLTTKQLGQAAVQPNFALPLVGMPGVMRLRIQRFQANGPWLITGLYDTVRGLQMGEPVV